MRVVGIGNALVDVLAHIDSDELLDTLELPKGSMQLIDEVKLAIVSAELSKLNPSIVSGGSVSNAIVGLANLGVETGFIGRIGLDDYGNRYKADLEKYGVKLHLTLANEASGLASAFISKDGERTFGTYLGAAALLNADELKPEDFEGYDICLIEGYLLQNHDLITRAIGLAKSAGCKVALDLASYNIVEANRQFLIETIPNNIDIVFANEEEAKAMVGGAPERAVSFLAQLVNLSVVKAGAEGSWIQQGKEKVYVEANKEVNCVDTTGAGDLYAAGFLYGWINKASLKTCGKIGTILAANVIEAIGPKIIENRWASIREQIKYVMANS